MIQHFVFVDIINNIFSCNVSRCVCKLILNVRLLNYMYTIVCMWCSYIIFSVCIYYFINFNNFFFIFSCHLSFKKIVWILNKMWSVFLKYYIYIDKLWEIFNSLVYFEVHTHDIYMYECMYIQVNNTVAELI